MLAKDLLERVRFNLSDTDKSRFHDKDLLILLNAGIRDLAKNTIFFVENTLVPLVDLVVDIDLSANATKIVRVEYLDRKLELATFEEMDRRNRDWQKEEGETPIALVYDTAKNSVLKLYPIIKNAYNPNITYPNGIYGVITDISYNDIGVIMANHYGDLEGVPPEGYLKFYYIRKHAKVEDINDELIIDDLCEQTLVHYVTGHAMRANKDAQQIELGTQELQFYYQTAEEYSLQKEENFIRTPRQTTYNGGI